MENKWEPKWGEEVEIYLGEDEGWVNVLYVAVDPTEPEYLVIVITKEGSVYRMRDVRQIKPRMTRAEAEQQLGVYIIDED